MDRKIKKTLEKAALQYETETFLFDDPSFFMHIPADNHDKEIMAFIASCLSYGRRELFFPKIQYILDSSEGKLSSWLLSDAFKENIPDNQQTFYHPHSSSVPRQPEKSARGLWLHGKLCKTSHLQSSGYHTDRGALHILQHRRTFTHRTAQHIVKLQKTLHVSALDGTQRLPCRPRSVE